MLESNVSFFENHVFRFTCMFEWKDAYLTNVRSVLIEAIAFMNTASSKGINDLDLKSATFY